MRAKKKLTDPRLSQRQRLVDEWIALEREVDAFKPRQFRHEKIRRLILDWYPELEVDQETIAEGTDFDILITAKDRSRSVTPAGKAKLFKRWGRNEYIARSTVQLKNLPDPKDELGLYTEEELKGPRHLHVVAKGIKAEPAA